MAEYKQAELDEKSQFNPSKEEVEVVKRVHQRFLDMRTERDKVRREFDGRTLKQYVEDSMDAYNGIVSDEIKATKEDWQSLSWDHITRGKLKTLIAMVVGARPFVSIIGKSRSANKYAQDMLDIYEDTWKQEKGSYKLFLQAMSAACKGTVIVEEMYVEEKVKQKDITSIDQQTGKIKFNEKEVIKGGVGKVECRIKPLLKFYPNENSAEIEHDCCVLNQYTKKAFLNKYGKYPNAEVVQRGNVYFDFNDSAYKEQTTQTSDLIDVISYYNEDWDEYIVMANDIWLNKQEGDKVGPIPFDHHRLPFAKGVFELADEECFYGKSFPDLTKGEQDPANALIRLMVDREILSLNRGFVLGAGVEIDSYELFPGSVKKLTGPMGVPIDQLMMEQQMTGANQSGFMLLNLLKANSNENTAVDPIASGVAGGGRKTAREAVILDENAKRNSGPFQIHIYKLLWDRAELRIENIKQFYTDPLQTTVLKDKQGSARVNSDGSENPTGQEYRSITVSKPGKFPTWLTIKPEIKGCEFEIRFVEDLEVPQSQSARIEMGKALLDESKVNPLISADESTINYLEAIRMNPDRYYLKPKPQAIKFQEEQGLPPKNPMPNNIIPQ